MSGPASSMHSSRTWELRLVHCLSRPYSILHRLTILCTLQLIGVTVGECSNPRRNIPSAIKKTFWRILSKSR